MVYQEQIAVIGIFINDIWILQELIDLVKARAKGEFCRFLR
jgi:hypothetical protein